LAAQHNDSLVAVGPLWKGENDFERVAPDYKRVHGCEELFESVRLASARVKEIETTVATGQESIDTDSDKD
jgi:hypothetical protein